MILTVTLNAAIDKRYVDVYKRQVEGETTDEAGKVWVYAQLHGMFGFLEENYLKPVSYTHLHIVWHISWELFFIFLMDVPMQCCFRIL